MKDLKEGIFIVCFSCLAIVGLSQDYVHPLAIEESENTLVYYMNQDKEIIPADISYSYKRVAERKRKKKPYHVLDYFPNGAIEMETWMDFPDPVSNRYQKGYVSYFQSGDTNVFFQYDDQRKNGKHLAFYKSGQLKQSGQYIDGKKSGFWQSYYESGTKKEEGVYLQGSKHGVWDAYHEVGNKSSSGMYVKGKKEGKWEQYHSTGDYAVVNHYVNGELNGPYKGRYTTGSASEFGEYVKGKKQGEWNTFFENADKKSVMYYENGILEGNYMVLGDNKDELTVGEMYSNLFTGFGQVLSPEGDLIIAKYYTEGEVGKRVYYNSGGSMKRVDKLEHDGLKSTCYDTSGNETTCAFESFLLPHGNKDFESELASSLEYKRYKNYTPRGVYGFDVDTDGIVQNPQVVESANSDYDAMVLEKIRMLKWNPGFEAATRAVFSNHVVIHFDEVCKVSFGEFYLNDSLLLKDAVSHNPELDLPDHYPSFRVGMTGLTEYMADELKYPEMAKNEGVSGICITKFAIEPSGVLSEIEVVGSVHPLLDYESIRFLENMPTWIPGTRAGRKIKMYNHLPIRFTLN